MMSFQQSTKSLRELSRRAALIALTTGAAGLLSGCGLLHGKPTFRFRMTVELQTVKGLKSGSSVMEYYSHKEPALLPEEGSGFRAGISRGEAVVVDAPSGPIFALLTMSNGSADIDVLGAFAPELWDRPWEEKMAAVRRLSSEDGIKVTLPRAGWPMMVRFADANDPSSVERVDPAAIGVKRILLETTNEDVTVGIQKRLRWLHDGGLTLDPDGGPTITPTFAQTIRQRAFTTEIPR